MNEPRSSEMSAKTTCGDETWKPSLVLQESPKSTRIFTEIDGRMFARSAPSVLKSTTRGRAEVGAALDADVEDRAEVAREQVAQRQLAALARRRVRRLHVDVAAEEDRADLHVLEMDVRVRRAAVAGDLDRAVAVQVDAVGDVEREEEQPAVDLRAVDAAARAVDARERDERADGELGVVGGGGRARARRAAVGDEVEAVVDVDAEAEVEAEAQRDLRREAGRDAERRDAEVEVDRRRRVRERLAELEVELDLLRVEDVRARAARVARAVVLQQRDVDVARRRRAVRAVELLEDVEVRPGRRRRRASTGSGPSSPSKPTLFSRRRFASGCRSWVRI